MEKPAKGNIFGCGCIPARYTFAIMGCFGVALVYGLKVNLHVEIIAMVNHTYAKSHRSAAIKDSKVSICHYKAAHASKQKDGPFKWDEHTQSIVLSSYFIGYLLGQLPGGRAAEMYSAFWVFYLSAIVNIAGTLVTPLACNLHWGALVFVRFLMGFSGGFNFPAMHVLLAHWCPNNDRSFIASVVYAGLPLGTVLFQLSTGYIGEALSWQAVFYVHGGIGSVFLPLWYFMVSNTPQTHMYISQEERDMISANTDASHDTAKMKVPWKKIWTSGPFWAILLAQLSSDWGFYMLLIELPQYMKRVLNFSLQEITTYTAIPYLTMWLFSLANGKLLDYLTVKGKLSITKARKISTSMQAGVPGVCLALVCVFKCARTVAVVAMTIALTFYGAMFSGFLCNHIDIAPNLAGTLFAITNGLGSVGGVVVPLFCGQLFQTTTSFTPWMVLFAVTIALYCMELIVYNLMATGELQSWNSPAPTEEEAKKQ